MTDVDHEATTVGKRVAARRERPVLSTLGEILEEALRVCSAHGSYHDALHLRNELEKWDDAHSVDDEDEGALINLIALLHARYDVPLGDCAWAKRYFVAAPCYHSWRYAQRIDDDQHRSLTAKVTIMWEMCELLLDRFADVYEPPEVEQVKDGELGPSWHAAADDDADGDWHGDPAAAEEEEEVGRPRKRKARRFESDDVCGGRWHAAAARKACAARRLRRRLPSTRPTIPTMIPASATGRRRGKKFFPMDAESRGGCRRGYLLSTRRSTRSHGLRRRQSRCTPPSSTRSPPGASPTPTASLAASPSRSARSVTRSSSTSWRRRRGRGFFDALDFHVQEINIVRATSGPPSPAPPRRPTERTPSTLR